MQHLSAARIIATSLAGLLLAACGSQTQPAPASGTGSASAPPAATQPVDAGAVAPAVRNTADEDLATGQSGQAVLGNGELHADVPAPVSEPASEPATESAIVVEPIVVPAADAPDPAPRTPVDDLLERLEVAAADLESFTADIRYDLFNDLLGRTEIRRGELLYLLGGDDGTKRFAVLFDTLQVNRTLLERPKHYVFDGQWLAEIDHDAKIFLKQQVVPPGRQLDPGKLGEGPFPLPIGQPRDEVLARFDAQPFEIPSDGPLGKVRDDYEALEGLLLVPRPEAAEAREYARLELLYDRATLLPVGINVVLKNGNRKTVRLTNPRRNEPLDEPMMRKLDIEEPTEPGWDVTIQPWKG